MIFWVELIFLVGCITIGILWVLDPNGNYEPCTYLLGVSVALLDLYRRAKSQSKSEIKESSIWSDIESRFPQVLSEMKADFNSPEHSGVRKFFVKRKGTVVNAAEPCFEYHTDVHTDLVAAISYLEDLGLIQDITPGNCPMYRFKEDFVDYLKNST